MGSIKKAMMEEEENLRILQAYLDAELIGGVIPHDIIYEYQEDDECCVTYNDMCKAITWSIKEINFWKKQYLNLKEDL
jgi:hypothetical protein